MGEPRHHYLEGLFVHICGGETDLQKSQLALAFVHQVTLTAIDYTVVWKITSDAFCV